MYESDNILKLFLIIHIYKQNYSKHQRKLKILLPILLMLIDTSLIETSHLKEQGEFDLNSDANLGSDYDRFSENQSQEYVHDQRNMKRLVKEFKIQLIAQTKILRKSKSQKNTKEIFPLDHEIQHAFNALTLRFPDKDIFQIVIGLYQQLVPQNILKCKRTIVNPKESEQQIKERLYKNHPISRVQRNIHAVENIHSYVGFKKLFLKNAWKTPSLTSSYQEMLYRMKLYAARSFVNYGHSLHHFRKEIALTEDRDVYYHRYYPSLLCVVTDAYKFIQNFVLEDCQIKIALHPRQVFKQLFYRFIHCRKAFKNEECTVFLNIIKIIYGIEDVMLDQYSTVKLYLVIQRGLRMNMFKKLMDQTKPNEPQKPIPNSSEETKKILYERIVANSHILEPHNVFTFQIQRELIEVYKRMQHFRDIKNHFRAKYPDLKKFLQGPSLKYRLNQIIRIALRRLIQIVSKNSEVASPLVKITKEDDNNIAYIVQAARSLKARLMLVDIYLANQQSYTPQIEEVVQEINQAISERHRYKWRDMYVRRYYKEQAKKNKQYKGAKDDDKQSTISTGSKFYAPTSAKDLVSMIPLKQTARKPAYLSHLYYKQEGRFINYAKLNNQSIKDSLSQIRSESSQAYRLQKMGENEDYDTTFYYSDN